VLVRVDDVPGFWWQRWEGNSGALVPVTVDDRGHLDNGHVRVDVDPATGTFSIDGRPGFGRLVDGGDNGDTYNYNPPANDELVDAPLSTSVRVDERGPLRGRVTIEATYRWPERGDGEDRVGARDVAVHTTIELRAGERIVRVSTAFVNACRDHRLRAHFPLPAPATTSPASRPIPPDASCKPAV
jgi:alpha-mannosidase